MTLDRRRLLAVGAALPFVASTTAAFAARRTPGLIAPILGETGAPALAGAVVTAQGLAFLDAEGRRRADAPETVTREDPWHLGSNTKAMTATLYGKLVEQGRAAWSARLPTLFPDLKLDPAWADTRIEDVLAHRAGLTDVGVIDAFFLSSAHADPRPAPVQRTAFAQTVLGAPPKRTPGGFEYANANYVVAGAAIERIAKAAWEDAITAELFRPLGMTSAGFGAPTGAAPWGHQLVDGRLHPVDPSGIADNPVVLGPAGRVHASLADYGKFVRLFLTDGGGFLQPDTLNRLGRPWGGGDGDYGLGWRTYRERAWAKGPMLEHEGSNTLWDVLCQVAPARGVAVIAASNAEAGGGAQAVQRLALALTQRFAA